MTAKAPPIPAENLSPKGPERDASVSPDVEQQLPDERNDSARQGQEGNTRVNLTPQNNRGKL